MKTCSELRHLEQFGIKILTGEADALGYRTLCDLDEQGVRVFKECFGMDVPPKGFHREEHYLKLGLNDNWNSGSIASVMLTGHELVPLAIMGFYLQGYDVVVTKEGNGYYNQVFALEPPCEELKLNDAADGYLFMREHSEDWQKWPDCYGEICRIIRQKRSDGNRVQGTRNVHQMTGRAS